MTEVMQWIVNATLCGAGFGLLRLLGRAQVCGRGIPPLARSRSS